MSSADAGPVLVCDTEGGQTFSAVGAVRALATAGHTVHVAAAHRFTCAAWSRHCSQVVPVPSVTDPPAFATAVTDLIATGRYQSVFVSSDAELIALDWPGAKLVDKAEVARRSAGAGFSTAHEHTFADGDELLAAADSLRFPLVVKPVEKVSAGSGNEPARLPVFRAEGLSDLSQAAGYPAPVLTQDWITGELQGMSGVIWDDRLRAVVHQRYLRTWPNDCGIASYSIVMEPDLGLEARLLDVLRGHRGVFNVQYLGDHILDVNPRIYGSVLLTAYVGANLPDLATRLARGEPVGLAAPVRADVGRHYRWVEGDLRNLGHALAYDAAGWRYAAAWMRPHRATVHADVSLHDPLPTVARALHAIKGRLVKN